MANPETMLAQLICADKSYLDIAKKYLFTGEDSSEQIEKFSKHFRYLLQEENEQNRLQARLLTAISESISWPAVVGEIGRLKRARLVRWDDEGQCSRRPTTCFNRRDLEEIICL